MQGNVQAAERAVGHEAAELAFKRFILDETASIEQSPEADLYRVNTLAQMLDRFDDYTANGADTHSAIGYVRREFSGLSQRMCEAGFHRAGGRARAAGGGGFLTEDAAARYIQESEAHTRAHALGVALCSACVMPLMLLVGLDTLIMGYAGDASSLIGLCGMFVMIAAGVYKITTAKKPEDAARVRKKRFLLPTALRGKLTALQEMKREKSRRRKGLGIALLVSCVLPIFLGAALDALWRGWTYDAWATMGVGGMFAMIGAGVYELIVADGEKKSIDKLLKE